MKGFGVIMAKKANIEEELTKSDVASEVNSKMRSKEFEDTVKRICAEVLSDMYKTFWQKKSFWKGDVTR